MQNAEDPSPRALSLPSDDAKKARLMGYGLLAITMFIWGSFTLISRLGATQSMTAWDISALRLFTASIVLIPIQIYRREWRFLLDVRVLCLALVGGIAYTSFVYEGFSHAPAAHAAIWMNGLLPFWIVYLYALFVVIGFSLTIDWRDTMLSSTTGPL